jgi:transcriptional regulator with XRE-family HTH domain
VISYTKWDRDAYIERVGGPEEAERRRKALMARQSGHRLAEEPKQRGLTQAQLAETMGVTPGRVSRIERGELSTIEAIARYVQVLGGHLELVANFTDHTHGDHYRSCLAAEICRETRRLSASRSGLARPPVRSILCVRAWVALLRDERGCGHTRFSSRQAANSSTS